MAECGRHGLHYCASGQARPASPGHGRVYLTVPQQLEPLWGGKSWHGPTNLALACGHLRGSELSPDFQLQTIFPQWLIYPNDLPR